MKNKKLKWAIPATVLALTGGSMVALTGCDNGGKPEVPPEPTHTHQYTEWDFTQSEHWKFCPDDGTVNEASREAHDSADETGKCPECGYQLFEYIDQAAKLVLRKEGANTAIPLLDNVTIVIKQGGKTLVDGADYTIEKGEGNALKIKKIVLGDYRVEIATTDGQYSYSGVIGFDGTAEKEIVLQYKYAVATEKPDVIDLTGMNDEMPTLKIKSSGAAAFEYWNAPVPEIALTLTDQEKSSLDVTLEFNLKGENSNNQPCNSFGIVMTEDYAAGVGLSFWNIEDESGNFVFEMIGQKLGCDNFQNNGYKGGDENAREKTIEWLTKLIYGEKGADFQVTRKGGTISVKAKRDGNWTEIATADCGAVVTNDIKFLGVGSDYTITVKSLTAVEFVEETVTATFASIGDDTFNVDGVELTFTGRHTYKGTPSKHTLTIADMAVGDYNVSATVNGLTVGLGRATVTKNDEDIGVGTLTLDGNIGENAEAAYAGYNLKDLAITLDLKNGGNVYHNKFVTGITAAETNYILYKISLPQDMKVALTGNTSKKLNISMPIIINGGEPSSAKFVFENGKVLSSFWGDGVNDAGYGFYGHEVDLGSDFWTALTTGDGFYMVAYINKTDKNLRVYVGTALNEMRLTEDVTAIYNDGVNTIGIAMGNAVDVASMSDGDQVTVAIKYGTTMAEVGTQEAAKHSVTTSVAEGSEDMGSISASGECYVNTNYTVTVTANAGYELESLTVGGTAVDMKDVTKTGLTYTYTFRVTADTAVVAEFRQAATVNATFTASGEDAPASGTAIKLTNTSTNVVKDAVIGTAIALEPGTYKLLVYGYAEQEVEVTTDGTIALMLAKTIAYASANDTKGEITINDTDKTISFNGNGAADRNGDRKISADLVLTEEQKNAKELTLTFTIKRGEFTRNGDDWAASRFGVQLGTGEVGFYVFMRSAQNNAADVAKLINNSLSLNPSGSEQKWHGNDPDISWVSDAAYGGGLQMKVVRSGGVIHIYALNGTTWVQLDVAAGVSTDGEGNTAGGYLAIDDSVENEIKLLAGGDDWTYSGITVETTAWTPTTEVGEEA